MSAAASAAVETPRPSREISRCASLRRWIYGLPRPVQLVLFVGAVPVLATLVLLVVGIVAETLSLVLLVAIFAYLHFLSTSLGPAPAVAVTAGVLLAQVR